VGLTTGQTYTLVGAQEYPPTPVVNGAIVLNMEARLWPPAPIRSRGVELAVNLLIAPTGEVLAGSQALADD
jgi:hypothetical protein